MTGPTLFSYATNAGLWQVSKITDSLINIKVLQRHETSNAAVILLRSMAYTRPRDEASTE